MEKDTAEKGTSTSKKTDREEDELEEKAEEREAGGRPEPVQGMAKKKSATHGLHRVRVVKVEHLVKNDMLIEIREDQPMKILKEQYAQRSGYPVGSVQFLHRGEAVDDDETLEDLELEENERIDTGLMRDKLPQKHRIQYWVRVMFHRLVKDGSDPNEAAVQALAIVREIFTREDDKNNRDEMAEGHSMSEYSEFHGSGTDEEDEQM